MLTNNYECEIQEWPRMPSVPSNGILALLMKKIRHLNTSWIYVGSINGSSWVWSCWVWSGPLINHAQMQFKASERVITRNGVPNT